MAYYGEGPWSPAGAARPAWEQPAPPSRSGASSAASRDDAAAFGSQFEEVDRATDNLMKSGKMFNMPGGGGGASNRRDSAPITPGGRSYADFDPRHANGPAGAQRHHAHGNEFEGQRPLSASNLQGYYANQRFGPRPNETDQMLQAKRRMAAQRERDLRNYHQEQQYTRNVSGGPKSDRSMSPSTGMSEEDRRALIARQHQALYGTDSSLYAGDGSSGQQRQPQDARLSGTSSGPRGPSPLAFDPFGGMPQSATADGSVQMPPRDQMSTKDSAASQRSRAGSASSPSSNPTTSGGGFNNIFETAQQSTRTSTSSPGGSPPRQGGKPQGVSGVGPIGSRPSQGGPGQAPNPALSKQRATTPLPSPLSYGFSANDQNNGNANNGSTNNNTAANGGNDRSTSAASNPPTSAVEKGVIGWGNNSGVWGTSKNTLQASSVWG